MVNKPTNPPRHSRKAAGFSWLQASGLNGLLLAALPWPNFMSLAWSAHVHVPISELVLQATQGSSDSAGLKGGFIGRKP